MKPTRGSERVPSKATKGKKPSEKGKKRRKSQENLQAGTSGTVPQPKSKKNKVNAAPRKLTGQEKWKPLSESSITALDKMLALSVLSVLAVQRTGKEESQKHLNILRTRFIAKCAQLAVPFQKQETLGNAFRQHQEESRKATVGRKNLTMLEADLSAVVISLEKMEEQRDSLEHQCSNLRKLLAHEEDGNQQVLQLSNQGVLHLPTLPPRKHRDTPLQKRLLTLVPGEASTTVARNIAKTLQAPGPLQDARALLEQAYKHADHMLTPAAISQTQEVSTNPLGQ
ncbi:centromere protein Q isoform X2 [Esox lucius]|uniref:centromere protein Q isoform X2 n=1 Tax=Esox lucius TaxID=8010 RepID=UPI001476EAF5|nr:centromere protein Q isoform X2 [Esox lucius]